MNFNNDKQTRVMTINFKNIKSKMYKFSNQLISKSSHLLIMMLISSSLFAQAPQKMSYQAVIRNSSNELITSLPVGMQISILQGSSTGIAVYIETQTPSTNANGLVSVEIGSGTIVTGTFAGIDWAAGPYFIKAETDPTGGTAYSIKGTSELMSVPYALHAETAATATKLATAKNINGVPFDGTADITITANESQFFEKELVNDGENSIAITFPLVASSKIYYNGNLLKPNQWSGVGLTTLTLILDTRQNDQLTVTN
mgnify:CR=1 FL=1|tara:strand:+ start:7730 stop:8500 length:771 start_codon:yes stop_codon:yes gene_type:complete